MEYGDSWGENSSNEGIISNARGWQITNGTYDNIIALFILMSTCCQDDDATTWDPFFDTEQHVLLGVASIFTQCLLHHINYEYDSPIIAPTGKVTIL